MGPLRGVGNTTAIAPHIGVAVGRANASTTTTTTTTTTNTTTNTTATTTIEPVPDTHTGLAGPTG